MFVCNYCQGSGDGSVYDSDTKTISIQSCARCFGSGVIKDHDKSDLLFKTPYNRCLDLAVKALEDALEKQKKRSKDGTQ